MSVWSLVFALTLGACGSCGGAQSSSSDRTPIPVTFTLRNATDGTVYLPSQSDCEFGVLQIGDLSLYGGQNVSCDQARVGPCDDFGDCGAPGLRPIPPGGSWPIEWTGLAFRRVTLEADEIGDNCPSECLVWFAPDPGTYPVVVAGYGDCESCECSDGSEYCYPDEPRDGPPDLRARAQLTLPERASGPLEVEVVFD